MKNDWKRFFAFEQSRDYEKPVTYHLACFPRPGDQAMTTHRLLALSATALALSTLTSHAGPCSPEIGRMQARVDAKLEAVARKGPSAPESSEARLHRQPTPGSIAAAESRLGEMSSRTVEAIGAGMARAREADRAGDKSACERALADVQRAITP